MLPINREIDFNNYYRTINEHTKSNQNNKSGVVYTTPKIARDMVKKLNPTMDETIWEPAVGVGVFIIAIMENIIEKYSPSPEQLTSYIENKMYFADIDKDSVDFTTQLIRDFMLEHYQVAKLSLNAKIQDSLLNSTHYDIIVGNPPYIRTKNIDKTYLPFLKENFVSCKNGNIDIYYAFIELANKYSTRSSLIIPNSYLTNISAKTLRELIKPNISFIRDFKDSKQFDTASTYTTILMLNKKTTDFFSYAKYDEEASLFKRDVLDEVTWNIDTSNQSKKYQNRDTKFSDIADVVSGINTNDDKLFLIDKSTLHNGYYKKIYAGTEYLIEKDICVDLIKISKTFGDKKLNQAIIFPYSGVNNIIEENILSKSYPYAYQYLQAVRGSLEARDRGNIDKYASWYAYGRKQGFNVDFTSKKVTLFPLAYRKDKFNFEKHQSINRFVHTSGFVIIPKQGQITKVLNILNSSDFKEYLEIYGTTMPGAGVNYNRVSATILKMYPYLINYREESLVA